MVGRQYPDLAFTHKRPLYEGLPGFPLSRNFRRRILG